MVGFSNPVVHDCLLSPISSLCASLLCFALPSFFSRSLSSPSITLCRALSVKPLLASSVASITLCRALSVRPFLVSSVAVHHTGVCSPVLPSTRLIHKSALVHLFNRYKDNSWDKLAEQRLEEFKELHEQQLALYGIDNFNVQEAYMKVLGTTSGYINGLGFGPKPPKGTKEGRSNGEGIEVAYQMAQQLEQLDTNSREREARLQERLEKDSKEREAQLQEQLEKDSRARKDELKKEIQSLQDGKVELLREMEKLKQDAAMREERMFEQLRSMQETMMRSMSLSEH